MYHITISEYYCGLPIDRASSLARPLARLLATHPYCSSSGAEYPTLGMYALYSAMKAMKDARMETASRVDRTTPASKAVLSFWDLRARWTGWTMRESAVARMRSLVFVIVVVVGGDGEDEDGMETLMASVARLQSSSSLQGISMPALSALSVCLSVCYMLIAGSRRRREWQPSTSKQCV